MKTERRFTPKVLDRFKRENRGTGTHENYIPWHRVSRGDPSSRGRSHIQKMGARQFDLLSDGELLILMFASMLPDVVDVREQFPLSHHSSPHELCAYTIAAPRGVFLGAIDVAEELGIKFPKCRGKGESTDWTPSTDLLITLMSKDSSLHNLAISVKVNDSLTKREIELLKIEEKYWLVRGTPWIKIGKDGCNKLITDLLSCTRGWALSPPVHPKLKTLAIEKSIDWEGKSLTHALYDLDREIQNFPIAQNTFWQSVWSGALTLDLRRGWRPHEPLRFLSQSDFLELNPIAVEVAKWI
jgi:hypothetical protein